jgi:hypothetical protein
MGDEVARMVVIKARYMLSPQEPPPFQWVIVIGLGSFLAALLIIAVPGVGSESHSHRARPTLN